MDEIGITHNQEMKRYEIRVGEELAGFAEYRLEDDQIVFPHTVVDPKFGGLGLGTELVRFALDDVRTSFSGHKVVPACSFVNIFIARHPEYQELTD